MKQIEQQVDYRLGDLLVELEVSSQEDIRKALGISAHTSLPLGKTLVMLDSVNEAVIRAVVEAQSMLRDRLIDMNQAREAIGIVRQGRVMFSDALVQLGVDASKTRGTRLGELLRDADQLNTEQLALGLSVSDYSGLPLGQVLVLLNKITEDKVRLALSLQRELRASHLERKDVVKRISVDQGVDATSQTLPALTLQPVPSRRIKLGELLICAEIVTAEEIDRAIDSGRDGQKMLGEILLEKKWISADVLTAALRMQAMMWDNVINLQKATSVLREAHRLAGSPDSLASINGLTGGQPTRNISLYEFLRITGYLSKQKIDKSMERIMDEPRLLTFVMNQAKNASDLSGDYTRAACEFALRDAATLRFIINETHPKDRPIVDSALVFHQLVQEGKLTLCQALVNFSIKINGIATGAVAGLN